MQNKLTKELSEKYDRLKTEIKAKTKLLIAYSGGVDSALLVKVAFDVLGEHAWAVLVDSETVPKFEASCAQELANEIGIKFEIIKITQLADEKFVRNDPKRCYFCRKHMAESLTSYAEKFGISTIAAGAQASDLDDYRPGISAFHEANIWHPFIELKFSKEDIRNLAKHLNLDVSVKPSMACLSSRISYGQEITQKNLEMIALAEDYLRELGFTQYRARTHDNLLRIEIETDEFEKLLKNRDKIIKKMKELGYVYVTLDLVGFKSGSMNETIDNR